MNTDQIKDKAEELQDKAAKTGRQIKGKAMQWHQAARNGATDAAKATDTYVRDNPWGAIGLTAVFAFALGLVIGRRD